MAFIKGESQTVASYSRTNSKAFVLQKVVMIICTDLFCPTLHCVLQTYTFCIENMHHAPLNDSDPSQAMLMRSFEQNVFFFVQSMIKTPYII